MTRQNCKNCGEPYTFDNLVTPGRATIICSACQKKIYVHTGQIYFETPTTHTSVNSSVKISLGQGVSIVKTNEEIQNMSSEGGKRFSPQQWKTFANKETSRVNSSHVDIDMKDEDMAMSMYQWVIVIALYGLFLAWGIIAIKSLFVLPEETYISMVEVRSFVIAATFAIFCLALAEISKWVWKRL